MHVHPPKPLHGWREFFGEVGVIVLGVLIALSGEQIVEALHWRHVTQESREALDSQTQDIESSLLSRKEMQDCVDRRLAEIETILKRHDAKLPLGIIGQIGSPTASISDLSAFDMAIANQAFSHISVQQQSRYFEMKGSYAIFEKAMDMERAAWKPLQALNRADTLQPSDWADIRKADDNAVDINIVFKTNLKDDRPGLWLFPFRGNPVPKDYSLRESSRVKALCQPMIS